jgi:hypothetical protein
MRENVREWAWFRSGAEAKNVGQEDRNTTVPISNADTAAKTFTHTVAWTQSVMGIKCTDLKERLSG